MPWLHLLSVVLLGVGGGCGVWLRTTCSSRECGSFHLTKVCVSLAVPCIQVPESLRGCSVVISVSVPPAVGLPPLWVHATCCGHAPCAVGTHHLLWDGATCCGLTLWFTYPSSRGLCAARGPCALQTIECSPRGGVVGTENCPSPPSDAKVALHEEPHGSTQPSAPRQPDVGAP